jgi:Zn-dependent peptidase ImmA (M78 family)/transcriptional regulator with XRE-family HTH domain
MLNPPSLGKCLQEARKRVRLSQTAVALRLGVTRQVISAYESGKREVSAEELKTLCNLFRVFPDELLGFRQPPDPSLSTAINFRMNSDYQTLTDHDRHELASMIRRAEHDEGRYFPRWSEAFKKYSAVAKNPFGTVQQLTERLRKDFEQEKPPINIYLLVERMGILLTATALDKVAAVVCRADTQHRTPPWIVVNSSQPLYRQRFSVAHEIAHLLLDQEEIIFHAHYFRRQSEQKEIDADAFAAELLIPRSLLKQSVENLNITKSIEESVFLLSHLYQVSFQAMATRLYNLDLITRASYNHLTEVKPSTLEDASSNKSPKRPFTPQKTLIPILKEELKVTQKPIKLDQEAVRKLQEIAYTRYLGEQTRGGTSPTVLYDLEPAGKVYEKVALWIADNYPMTNASGSC